MWTDASSVGFRAVLEQVVGNGERAPIAYASHAALVYALEHFEVYLLGNKVAVFTDHKALIQSYLPYLKSHLKVYWPTGIYELPDSCQL